MQKCLVGQSHSNAFRADDLAAREEVCTGKSVENARKRRYNFEIVPERIFIATSNETECKNFFYIAE